MADTCVECGKPAQPGSNLCAKHQLDGGGVTYVTQDIEPKIENV